MSFENLDRLLSEGIETRAYPSAVAVVGKGNEVYYKKAFGYSRVFNDDAPCFDVCPAAIPDTAIKANTDTLYDMASLSKLLSATMIALRFLEEGKLALYDTIGYFIDDVPEDKKWINIRHLMTHSSGITAHFHLENEDNDPDHAVRTILNHPLAHKIGEMVDYTCMGYILLGKILEKISGKTLEQLAAEYVFGPLGMKRTYYNPLEKGETNIAVTEFNKEMNKYIYGVVHDENARFLRGISANAGVFSCADDLARFGEMLSTGGCIDGKPFLAPSTFNLAASFLEEDRGLGFQLKEEKGLSTMGDLYIPGSYGHNGFTGTSLYVDKGTGIYAVLLTNRVHYTRASDGVYPLRRRFHNVALAEAEYMLAGK